VKAKEAVMRLMKATPTFGPTVEMEKLLNRFFNTPLWPLTTPAPAAEALWEPVLDFSETGKEYIVRLEVPGVTRDDLDVNFEGNILRLSGKRELARREKGEDFLWEEREEGRFLRTLRLPGPVAEGKIEATYVEGVLTVKLAKAEPVAKSKVIIR
jgi:HSP20 family protein